MPMFISAKRYRRLLAPFVAAAITVGVVAGVSLAIDSTPSSTSSTKTVAGVALQDSFVNVVRSMGRGSEFRLVLPVSGRRRESGPRSGQPSAEESELASR